MKHCLLLSSLALALTTPGAAAQDAAPRSVPPLAPLAEPAIDLLRERAPANRQRFYVFQDADSGFNHGFPSGFFASSLAVLGKIELDPACVPDPKAANGCSTAATALDRDRGTVLRITFAPLVGGEFAGVNVEEPENWGAERRGVGYDLRGATHLVFDARSPDRAAVQFGVGGGVTAFRVIPREWTRISIPLSLLGPPPDLENVHILLTVVTNDDHAPQGGTVLIDDVRFEPTPLRQREALAFPLSTESFGVVPRSTVAPGRVPIAPDQVVRNLTTTYESALALQILLSTGRAEDLEAARHIADAFHYALGHDNDGAPLPTAPDGSRALRNAYSSGDLALLNDQGPGAGRAGQVRLSGFSAGAELCGPSRFCLVLDGATGGNNAFALLALLAAYSVFDDERYLEDAREIGRWIVDLLEDTSATGFGGYFLGFPDEGVFPKPLIRGKSIENNADIFAAFEALAEVEEGLGELAAAADWRSRARAAGDFVMEMFDPTDGCFHAGSVPLETPPSPGIDPTGPQRGGEVINRARFLDANTFIAFALAHSPLYRDRIDWRQPARCVLDLFQRSVEVDGVHFAGFGLDEEDLGGPKGIAWEFTAQSVLFLRFVDQLYSERTFEPQAVTYLRELLRARDEAPFGDGRGLVASTLEDGAALPPLEQCLSTPFQCIPQRVGLAATTWGIFAERELNPLGAISQFAGCEEGPTALCLNGDRFKVRAFWRTADSPGGAARAHEITADTGYLWFFDPANIEVVVKVLDACAVNGHFWVFAAGLTNVAVELHVQDTARHLTRTYTNPLDTPFQSVQDTAAFATCP